MNLRLIGSVALICERNAASDSLCTELSERGIGCQLVPYEPDIFENLDELTPELLVVKSNVWPMISEASRFARKLKTRFDLPVILLIPEDSLDDLDVTRGIDDFILEPCKANELAVRIRQILWRTRDIEDDHIIKHADLVIDLDKYEVSIAGKLVSLSFKEYELLKVLIKSRDRVLTRDALLDKVWGHDYFGGDRTVDVHIRRLRSKIEDAEHSFIETVRNVGYRFKS